MPSSRISRIQPDVTPFRTFVLKVHSRCDLACDYCYVYNGPDQSWRDRPRTMSPEVAEHAARRIAEHVRGHRLDLVDVVLHGGEPLLCGPRLLGRIVTTIRTAVPARVRVSLQTNALRLDETYLRLFDELDVVVGVSMDGGGPEHDRHRRTRSGAGSHAKVSAAVRELAARPRRFGGLLCTVDLRNDPVASYEALAAHRPPAVDFLLPHGNWSSPPPGRPPGPAAPYGSWLAAVFDRWYDAAPRETGVRIFEEIIHLLLGGRSTAEGVGLEPVGIAVVETDGTIEQIDALKSAFDGAAATGLHVRTDDFDTALRAPGFAARQAGTAALSRQCAACPVVRVCGGGHYAHRYRAGAGFVHPSVYCPDLFHLIGHIRDRLAEDVGRLRIVAEPA